MVELDLGGVVVAAVPLRLRERLEPRSERLRGLARVDEDQGRLVFRDDLADRPDVARSRLVDRELAGQRRVAVGDLGVEDAYVGPRPRGDLDRLEPAVALAVRVASPGPDEEPTDLLGVADRRGEADALERARDAAEAFEPDRELRAALRGGELVDLVDDDVRDVL